MPVAKKQAEVALKEHEVLFLQSIRDILPTLKLHSDKMLTQKITYERIEDLSLQFKCFLEDGAGSLTKNEYLALANQSWKCVAKYVREILQLPVTLKTLLDSVSVLSEAVDNCFPGYAENHLMRYLIRERKD
jgi:phosphoketolase